MKPTNKQTIMGFIKKLRFIALMNLNIIMIGKKMQHYHAISGRTLI